jgi:hypothetical protein
MIHRIQECSFLTVISLFIKGATQEEPDGASSEGGVAWTFHTLSYVDTVSNIIGCLYLIQFLALFPPQGYKQAGTKRSSPFIMPWSFW